MQDDQSPHEDLTPPRPEPTDEATAAEIERLRVENEQLRAQVDTASGERATVRTRRRRGVVSIALVVLGALLLPLAVMTVWTRNQLLDTDRYLETVAPLGSDPAVVDALSTRISNAVTEAIDVKSLAQEALPENAQFLAAPIAAGAGTLVHEATTRLLRSDRFETLWIEANRTGHDGLVAVLTGRKGNVVATDNGKVVISLGPLVQEVLERVDAQFGTDISSRIPASKIDIRYTLVDSPQLAKLQDQVRWLDRLSYFTVVLALACFVGAVFAASERRKGVLRVGVGVAVSMLIALVAMSIARTQYLGHLPSQVQSTAAASAVFETLTRFLLQAFRVLFVVGAVILLAAWVAGPSRAATWVRTVWNRALGRGSSGIGGTVELGPVPGWVAAHLGLLRAAVAVVAALALVLWSRPTGKVVLLVALVALVLLAILQVLGGITPGDPSEPRGDDADAGPTEEEQVAAGA